MSNFHKKLRQILFNPKISKDQVLAAIKDEVSAGEYEAAINLNPLLQKAKLADSNFETIEDIFQRKSFGFTKDLRKEMYWILYDISKHSIFINDFYKLKLEFEKLFLLGKYDNCYNVLDVIKKDFGESLWTIEMSLLLKEYKFESKENWLLLSEYLTIIKNPFYQFIINFYSKRVEENISFDNCLTQFQNDFDTVISKDEVKDFLVFKSIFLARFDYTYKNFESIAYIASLFSVIDQYLIFTEILLKLISKNGINDKLVLQILNKLNSIDNDNRLKNIQNLISNEELKVFPKTNDILNIIDEYTLGNYTKCIELCKTEIVKSPYVFELYEVYCKSLVNQRLDFISIESDGMINRILSAMYNTLLFNQNSELYRTKVLKYALLFQSFDFGKQLVGFALELILDDNAAENSILATLSSSINNPKIISFKTYHREEVVVDKFLFLDKSPSVMVNKFIAGKDNSVDLKKITNRLQRDVYVSRKEYNLQNYKDVISNLEKYLYQDVSPFYYDNILYLLFDSYLNTNQLASAMKMFASIFAGDKIDVSKLNAPELISKVKTIGLFNFSENIELPILFSSVLKDYDLYEAYIEFMLFYDEEYPSKLDIDALIEKYSLKKLIFFFKNICTISTIQYSLEFNSIDKAESERLEILNLLKIFDPENISDYDKEITEILRAGSVRKAIKQVDQGRLYVNIESLKNLQLTSLKESFNRYKEIELITKDKTLIGYNSFKDRNWNNPEFTHEANPELNNLAFLAFKSIYVETRDKFLFSKEYGLESCLSGRIRHGTLKNLLRSVFEKLNLVTSKSNDIYQDNFYWDGKFDSLELNSLIQIRLKKFSREIDDLTTFIVDNLMQIMTERNIDKTEGLFDYSTSDTLLYDFFEAYKGSFDNYNALITRIYLELAAITSLHIVPYVQTVLKEDITNKFQSLIEELQMEIRSYISNNSIPSNELLSNISKSSTDIQTEIDNISEWFIFKTSDSSSLLDIETILNASKELTNRFNPSCTIDPEISLNYDNDLNVIASSVMIFVFHILMDNIIKHSKLSSEQLDVKIVVNQIPDYIEIKIMNNVSSFVEIKDVSKRLQEVSDNWNNHDNIERSNTEGGSGFDKIKRILLYEALCKTEKFEYSVNDTEVSISLFLPLIFNDEKSTNN